MIAIFVSNYMGMSNYWTFRNFRSWSVFHPLLRDHIQRWLVYYYKKEVVEWEMKLRFQKARYDLLVRALEVGFQYQSLFAMRESDCNSGQITAVSCLSENLITTIDYPILKYGTMKIQRVNYFIYNPLPDGQFVIKVLIGFGYIFFHDHLFFRPGMMG